MLGQILKAQKFCLAHSFFNEFTERIRLLFCSICSADSSFSVCLLPNPSSDSDICSIVLPNIVRFGKILFVFVKCSSEFGSFTALILNVYVVFSCLLYII